MYLFIQQECMKFMKSDISNKRCSFDLSVNPEEYNVSVSTKIMRCTTTIIIIIMFLEQRIIICVCVCVCV